MQSNASSPTLPPMKYREIKDVWIGGTFKLMLEDESSQYSLYLAMLTSNSLDTTVPTQDFALRLNSGEIPLVLDNPAPTPAGYGEESVRGGRGRGRGDRGRGSRGRGRGGRGGAAVTDGGALMIGKYPRNKTICVDSDGGNLCFAYQVCGLF